MKKISAFLDRLNKDFLAGGLCLVAALLMFFAPGTLLNALIKIAGALIVIAAVLRIVHLFAGSPTMPVTVLNGIFLFILGIVMLVMPNGMLRLLFAAIGAYLLINSLLQIIKLLMIPKSARKIFWWVDAVLSGIVLALGIWLLLSPAEAGRATEIIAGISLGAKSADLLCKAFNDRNNTGGSGDIEAEFIDKSDEL